jgi:hypothetical protein
VSSAASVHHDYGEYQERFVGIKAPVVGGKGALELANGEVCGIRLTDSRKQRKRKHDAVDK